MLRPNKIIVCLEGAKRGLTSDLCTHTEVTIQYTVQTNNPYQFPFFAPSQINLAKVMGANHLASWMLRLQYFVLFILSCMLQYIYFSSWSFLLLSVLQSLFLLTPVSPAALWPTSLLSPAVFYITVSPAISGPLSFPVSPVVPGTLYFSSPAALLCTFLSSQSSYSGQSSQSSQSCSSFTSLLQPILIIYFCSWAMSLLL